MADRIKLTVKSVSEVKTLESGKKLVNFSATSPDGKGAGYTAWDESLWAFLSKDVVLDAEVAVKETEKFDAQGGRIIQRTLKNIYIDGKPVIAQTAGAQGRGFGKTPEQLAAERASIEAQTAVKTITELEIAGKPVTPALIASRNAWLTKALAGK